MQANITDNQIPAWSPVRLNTKDFAALIPALYKDFPNMEMQINAFCTKPPNSVLSPSGASVVAEGDLEFYVILPNGTLANAFILSGNVSTSAAVSA